VKIDARRPLPSACGPARGGREERAMPATIIDGRLEADRLRARVAADAARLTATLGRPPALAVVRVGEDPASAIYVRTKIRQCGEAGIRSVEILLPATTGEDELLATVARLNADDAIDGILVQLPLPRHVPVDGVLEAIDPRKDVDGFHPLNVGRLASGRPGLVPCTPLGCLRLAQTVAPSLGGMTCVVLGRSTIVGRPAAALFVLADCTTTLAHSKTRDLPGVCRTADILVVAIGRPELVRGDWVKPGAIVLDVGINRVPGENGTSKIVGDVAYAEAAAVAGAITPVPGGAGPMTVAVLLENTVRCARLRSEGEAALPALA